MLFHGKMEIKLAPNETLKAILIWSCSYSQGVLRSSASLSSFAKTQRSAVSGDTFV